MTTLANRPNSALLVVDVQNGVVTGSVRRDQVVAHTEDRSAWGVPPPEQVIAHTNLSWQFQTAPGRTAEVPVTTDVDFGPTA